MRALPRLVALGWLLLLVVLAMLTGSRSARAEAPGARATPVHVLAIDSDDAEDQADALTGALRSRIRAAPAWSLQETQHSLGMLTAALRCPAKPDAACLQRIGDQLHTDRFIWGVLTKAPGQQVSAEVHLWARGKPDATAKETYSDNLKDQNDEVLRKIAARILDRVSGGPATGTITVHVGDAEGALWINGQRRQSLEHGTASVEVAPGTYTVEVRSSGFAPAQQAGVVVTPGQETHVALQLQAVHTTESPVTSGEGSHTDVRRIVAWTLVGAGAVAGVIAAVEGVRFLSLRSDLDNDRNKVPSNIPDVCAVNGATNPAAGTACNDFNGAKSARTTGVLVGSAGLVALAAGAALLLTDHGKEGDVQAQGTLGLRVLPYAAPREGGGVNVALTF
jgi:hypothetical protein